MAKTISSGVSDHSTSDNPSADNGMSLHGSTESLYEAICNHFDSLVDIYEQIWGEHIHHGYWPHGEPSLDRREAQLRIIRELITFGDIPAGSYVLDVGCGIGASSIFLATELGCRVEGITISQEQIYRAQEKAGASPLATQLKFSLVDAMKMPYPDRHFDCVWSLESCELMPNKELALGEWYRVLKPGGRLVVATWCSRGYNLSAAEVKLLRKIYRGFSAAYVLPLAEYQSICNAIGFKDVRNDDWTDYTRRTWDVGTELVKPLLRNPIFVWRLIRHTGLRSLRFATSVSLMKQAYSEGLMRYAVFRGTRPLL